MPERVGEITETGIIKDILRQLRRHRANALAQEPIWTYDTFTAPATYQLTSIPYGINALADNKSVLSEGADYTVDYTTGLITFAVAPTAGHVIYVSYVTNGGLIALSGPLDYGTITDTFNRADTTSAAGLGTTSDGTSTWTDRQFGGVPVWRISSNTAIVNAGSGASQIATLNPPANSANGTVSADVSGYSIGNAAGIVFRWSSNTAFWIVYVLIGTNASNVYKVNGGTFTSVGTFTATGSTTNVSVTLNGSGIVVAQNGTTVVTATDSYNSTANLHGIYATAGSVAIDNYNWTPA